MNQAGPLFDGTPRTCSATKRLIRVYLGTEQEHPAGRAASADDAPELREWTASEPRKLIRDAAMLEDRSLVASYGDAGPRRRRPDRRRRRVVIVIGPTATARRRSCGRSAGCFTGIGGEVVFDGERIDSTPVPRRSPPRGLVHIPQGDLPFGDMSVEENLALGAFPKAAGSHRADRLERVCTIFPALAERRSQRARTLSGGERRMLALGRGLMCARRSC